MSETITSEDEFIEKDISFEKALQLAMNLHQGNKLEEAEEVYRQLMQASPNNPDIFHFFGLLRHQRGYSEEGAEWIEKALELIPDYADAHNNLGNIYMQSGKPQFAAPCFRRAVELNPGFAAAYGNLGVALKDLKQFSEAMGCFRKAIEFEPEAVHHHQNLGNVYKNLKLYDEAVESYRKSLALNPLDAESYKKLIRIFYIMGEVEQSLEVVKQWLTYDPENPTALHTYAAYTKTDIPARASDGYVRQTFDGFAATFDTVLQRLEYQAPLLVKNALQRLQPDPEAWRLLDAGCGTGLFGELVRPMVKHLTGVDLSPRMLERAATRAVYDQLLEAELTAYFQRSQSVFEAVSCVDTLCYFGDLNEVMQSAVNILKPGGWFVFTLEKQAEGDTEPGFSLHLHGRYSHTESYVRQVLSDAGFRIETLETETLRMEGATRVAGLVVTARLA